MVASLESGTTARYYTSLADYYLDGDNARGVWAKVGIPADFKPGDLVDPAEFERLHVAVDRNGKFLFSNDGGKIERVGGYDMTFSAPKSVSVRWMLSDLKLRAAIELAQEQAVAHALDVLEQNAAFCRFGKGGAIHAPVRLTVATFAQSDTRPARHVDGDVFPDPQLHTHAVILNLAHEQRHRALDGKPLFYWKMAAGAAYHHAFANGLQALGFQIENNGTNEKFETVGVDPGLRRYFSARREAIEDKLEELGLTSAEAPALAAAIAKSTRRAKLSSDTDWFAFWRDKARALGFEPEAPLDAQGGPTPERTLVSEAARQDALIATRLAAVPRSLTETESAFPRRALRRLVVAQHCRSVLHRLCKMNMV